VSQDWEAEGLLEGLETDGERTARRELLDRLADEGCEIDELRRAVEEDRLALLPMEKLLLRDRRYSFEETAERTGLSVDYLKRNWQAVGLSDPEPGTPSHTEKNIDGMHALKAMLDAGVSEEEMLELTRLVGDASAKLADAALRTFGQVLLQPGDTERDFGLRLVDTANAIMPGLAPLLQGPLEAHLAEVVQHEAIGQLEREEGRIPGGRPVAICFADMVGFTKLSESLDIGQLGEVTKRFTEMVGETASAPVRLVKTIGDEAMLASEDAAALVDTALELIDAAERDDLLPQLRAGAAAGEALRRAGDWYGRPVNLAARITSVAPDGGLVANDALRDAAGDRFEWSAAGRRGFKGIEGEVELYRVERSAG
jgi:adenylate cyclase